MIVSWTMNFFTKIKTHMFWYSYFFGFVIIIVHARYIPKLLPTPPFQKPTTFTPKVVNKVCLLIPERGPCRSNLTKYFFNAPDKKCKAFLWGGCQGNGNRFNSEAECMSSCLSKQSDGIKRPRFCSLSFDYGFCFGAFYRYYYDNIWKTCKKTVYSGCGGNKNNFFAKEQCDAVCRFGGAALKFTTPEDHSRARTVIIVNPNQFTTPTTPKPSKKNRTAVRSGNDLQILNLEEQGGPERMMVRQKVKTESSTQSTTVEQTAI